MKKIVLKQDKRIVSAEFEQDTDLNEALEIVGGLLKSLDYCFDGTLGLCSEDDV